MARAGRNTGPRIGPGSAIAGYVVIQELGRGGMATVFEATAPNGARVALKILSGDGLRNANAVERFTREGRILKKLDSEHVARILDVGELPNGSPYHVIELLDGVDLNVFLATHGPLLIEDAVDYVSQACAGVAVAHGVGITHRDLKPANLFLASVGGRSVVKVLDFGVAKDLNDSMGAASLTRTSDVLGSPHYIAPEQFRNAKQVTITTDVWALGVVLYRLLTDHAPFDGASLPQLCMAILNDPPISLVSRRPDCPRALEAVVFRCLAKDPLGRYASVDELRTALEPFRVARIAVVYDDDPSMEAPTVMTAAPIFVPAAPDTQRLLPNLNADEGRRIEVTELLVPMPHLAPAHAPRAAAPALPTAPPVRFPFQPGKPGTRDAVNPNARTSLPTVRLPARRSATATGAAAVALAVVAALLVCLAGYALVHALHRW